MNGASRRLPPGWKVSPAGAVVVNPVLPRRGQSSRQSLSFVVRCGVEDAGAGGSSRVVTGVRGDGFADGVAQGVDQAPAGRQFGAQFPAATVAGGLKVFQRDGGGGQFGRHGRHRNCP